MPVDQVQEDLPFRVQDFSAPWWPEPILPAIVDITTVRPPGGAWVFEGKSKCSRIGVPPRPNRHQDQPLR
jgi:hypothetical protein